MNPTPINLPTILASGMLCILSQVAQAKEKAAPPAQKLFDTPELAVASLLQASETFEVSALKEILGPDSAEILSSEDPVMDKQRAIDFAAKAKEKQAIEIDPKQPDHAILTVGEDAYPLPIPMVKKKEKWSFDTKAGLKEILHRRIGANELDTIAICQGFVEAQHEYAKTQHEGARINQYAQNIISTTGKQDGLAWQNPDGTWDGPIGEDIAKAMQQGYQKQDKPQPYHGYFFKVLKGQGASAPMGKLDFVVDGAMIGGFALAAAPASYKVTGVKTFMVSHTGVVYEKDLGAKTLEIFAKMEVFEPNSSWQPTDAQW